MDRCLYRRALCLVMTICMIAFLSPDSFAAGYFAAVKGQARTNELDGNARKGKTVDNGMAEKEVLDGKPVLVTEDPSDVALSTGDVLPYHNSTVSIDTETGQVETEDGDSTTMDQVFSISKDERKKLFSAGRRRNKEQIEEYLQDEGVYSVDDSKNEAVTVSFPYVYKRLIVFAENGSLENSFGAVRISYFAPAGHYILEYPTEEAARDAHLLLENELGGEAVIPDLPIHACGDTFTETEAVSESWGVDMMHLDEVRDRINEDADMTDTITVAVLDSGINSEHELFAGRLADGEKSLITDTTSDGDSITMDDLMGHGSHVTGILADATPDQVKILPIKVLDKDGYTSFSILIDGLVYASERADLINLSLGGDMSGVEPDSENYNALQKLEEILRAAKKKKCICVASAGNVSGNKSRDIAENRSYPAFSEYVLAVTSINKNKDISSSSNYGDCIDFAAPGVSISSAKKTGTADYVYKSGTSMAAPHVTAACAVTKLYNRDAPNNVIIKYLEGLAEDLGDSGKDKYYGCGLITFKDDTVAKLEYDETSFDDLDEDDNNGSGDNNNNNNDSNGNNNGNSDGSSGNNNGSSDNNGSSNNKSSDGSSADKDNQTGNGTGVDSNESASATGFKKDSICKVSGYRYKVTKMATDSDPGTVTLTKAKNTKNAAIPATVKLGDQKKYKVTTVGAKAFTGGKIRTVTIGSQVSKIAAKAFCNSKARTVILKTKALKKTTVKGSLTGSKVKTVKVKLGSNKLNKKYRSKYKKIFTKKNAGKKVNVN